MPTINYAFREIVCKIVFYGPGLGGKTTNLQFVHTNVPQKHRGDLVSLATEQDRTLFFDFLPLDIGDVKGFKTKFQLYTVPGQVFYNATRKLVLRGADGVAFIADSQESRRKDNIDSFNNLLENLREYDMDLETTPFIMQYNKRDLPDAMPIAELHKDLNPFGKFVEFEAVATDGTGVRESLRELSSQILRKLNQTANITSDEQEVGERLGLLGSPPEAASTPVAQQTATTPGGRTVPELRVTQRSGLRWRGIDLGKGTLDISSLRTDQGDFEYTLTSNHRIAGIKRSFVRSIKYVGEDRRKLNGRELVFYVFRDVTPGMKPASVFVEKADRPRVYLEYAGIFGDISVAPEGEQFLV